jgi:hypothetical protein
MSLAYGVSGEIGLELENNYGDYSDWSREQLMSYIDKTLRNMLSFMDDPTEKHEVRDILRSKVKQNEIANDFIEEHGEYMTRVK